MILTGTFRGEACKISTFTKKVEFDVRYVVYSRDLWGAGSGQIASRVWGGPMNMYSIVCRWHSGGHPSGPISSSYKTSGEW